MGDRRRVQEGLRGRLRSWESLRRALEAEAVGKSPPTPSLGCVATLPDWSALVNVGVGLPAVRFVGAGPLLE